MAARRNSIEVVMVVKFLVRTLCRLVPEFWGDLVPGFAGRPCAALCGRPCATTLCDPLAHQTPPRMNTF